MTPLHISIFGATGYIGLELIRLLQTHPNFQIKYLYGPQNAGKKLSDLYPHLSGITDLAFTDLSAQEVAQSSDLVFLCLPHGVTQEVVPEIIGKTKIVDLSGDFRHEDETTYQHWYGSAHQCPDTIPEFQYVIPEIHPVSRDCIANPGCFAATIQLALFPIKDLIETVSVQAITGSSGSGKNPSIGTHHPLRDQNLKSYKVGSHQHTPEICQTLDITPEQIQFIPTSGPFVRGIFATCFVTLNDQVSLETVKKLFAKTYENQPFIRIKDAVELVDVVGSNFCDIAIKQVNDQIVIQACLDNLIKGAGGSAIQSANIMFDLEPMTGLSQLSPTFL